jgi:5-formyltetrahydrofolate cyclo-ligase
MNFREEKKNLRNRINLNKKTFSPDELRKMSYSIFSKVEAMDIFQHSEIIMTYWSLEDEVNTHEFILKWHGLKTILLPVIQEDILVVKQFTDTESLVRGNRFEIDEPEGELFAHYEKIDLILVPGMAFDKNYNRIGRGKGYYDRFLHGLDTFKIGICFHFQLLENIPVSETDIAMDMVITDK